MSELGGNLRLLTKPFRVVPTPAYVVDQHQHPTTRCCVDTTPVGLGSWLTESSASRDVSGVSLFIEACREQGTCSEPEHTSKQASLLRVTLHLLRSMLTTIAVWFLLYQ